MTDREPGRPGMLEQIAALRARIDELERMDRGYSWDPTTGEVSVAGGFAAAVATIVGQLAAGSLQINGAGNIDGTLTADALQTTGDVDADGNIAAGGGLATVLAVVAGGRLESENGELVLLGEKMWRENPESWRADAALRPIPPGTNVSVASTPPDSYPAGITISGTVAPAGGWPGSTGSRGIVLTVSSGGEGVGQIIWSAPQNNVYVRSRDGTNGWTAWSLIS